jgi:hypothetical protein
LIENEGTGESQEKDEGGRMKDEVKASALTSSFILPPSSFN